MLGGKRRVSRQDREVFFTWVLREVLTVEAGSEQRAESSKEWGQQGGYLGEGRACQVGLTWRTKELWVAGTQ